MTGPSTMAHHHELHDRIADLEAEVERLTTERGVLLEHARKWCACEARGCSVAIGFADADRRGLKVAIQRGGRESVEVPGNPQGPTQDGGKDSTAGGPSHAAEPAAPRKERDG